MKRSWTPEELQKLKEISASHTLKELAALFDRTLDSIRDKIRKHELHTKGLGRGWKEQQRIATRAKEIGIEKAAESEGLSYDTVASIYRRVRARKKKMASGFDGEWARRIRFFAFNKARGQGFSVEDAEDFASYRVLKVLEGNTKSSVEQTLVDYKRMHWGDFRTEHGLIESGATRFAHSISPTGEKSEATPLDETPAQPEFKHALYEALDRIPELPITERVIFLLSAYHGFENREIAFLFGVDDSRISQILSMIRTKIQSQFED